MGMFLLGRRLASHCHVCRAEINRRVTAAASADDRKDEVN